MNIEDVKQISIADYLHSLGYSPVKRQGNGLWYKSPLREEHEASFKVNTDRNLWYDFGAGKGGNIIALAKELYFSDSLPYLLKRIEEQTPNVRPVSFSFPQCRTEPSFQHLEVRDLTHPALLRYLQGRGINIELAKRECKELHFTNNGKPFFAIGFPNMAGGYEVRNSFFKGRMTGMLENSRSFAMAVIPSIPGIITSDTITSGTYFIARRIPVAASGASNT